MAAYNGCCYPDCTPDQEKDWREIHRLSTKYQELRTLCEVLANAVSCDPEANLDWTYLIQFLEENPK